MDATFTTAGRVSAGRISAACWANAGALTATTPANNKNPILRPNAILHVSFVGCASERNGDQATSRP
jgi:hypothetical protein